MAASQRWQKKIVQEKLGGGVGESWRPGDPRPENIITAFQPLDDSEKNRTVSYGTEASTLGLPTRLKVVYDGSPVNASVWNVKWRYDNYDAKTPGTYTFYPVFDSSLFTFAEDIEYPVITVTVNPESSSEEIVSIEVSAWDELKEAVGNLDQGATLKAKITASLEASSELAISGKNVILYTEEDDIGIKRTLVSGSNSTDAIFNLSSNATLTVGLEGNKITYTDDNLRQKNTGLFEVYSGSTLNLSNAEFINLNNGYSQNDGAKGAIYTKSGTVNLENVSITGSKGASGTFIYIEDSAVKMTNCTVSSNKVWGNSNQGGVIYTSGKSTDLTIENCTISDNSSMGGEYNSSQTGALHFNDGKVTIQQTEISRNLGQYGAGINAYGTDLTLSGVKIQDNICQGDISNKTWWQGAGIYIENCTLSMTDTSITGNTGSFIGGGMYITGTDVTLDSSVTISGNSAVCGGGFYTDDPDHTITVDGAKISNNKAVQNNNYSEYASYNGCGGGIADDSANVVINSGDISGNEAETMSGGVLNYGTLTVAGGTFDANKSQGWGGAILNTGTLNISGGTISGNTSTEGEAVYQAGTMNLSASPAISGEVYLDSVGASVDTLTPCIINVTGVYTPNSPLLIDIARDMNYKLGRDVLKYADGLEVPDSAEIAKYQLDSKIAEDFGIVNNLDDSRLLELGIVHDVSYEFIPSDGTSELPQDVLSQLPPNHSVQQGQTVKIPEDFDFKDVEVSDGIWSFQSWDKEKVENVSSPVTFTGTWKFFGFVEAEAMDLVAYEGGLGSGNSTDTGNALPEPTWSEDFSDCTITIDGAEWDTEEKGLPFTWKYLDSDMKEVASSARIGTYALWVYPLEEYKDKYVIIDDEYVLYLPEDGVKAAAIDVRDVTNNENADNLSAETFKYVYNYEVSNPEQKINKLLTSVRTLRETIIGDDFNENGTHDGSCDKTQPHAHVATGTTFYKNGNLNLPINDKAKIGLLYDNLLSDVLGNDTQMNKLHKKSLEAEGVSDILDVDGTISREFKYLDLVDMNDGNVWVGTKSEPVTVYMPYTKDMTEDDRIVVVYFDNLTRDYTVNMKEADLNEEIEKSQAHRIEVTKTDTGILFDVPSQEFGPFEILYQKSKAVTGSVPTINAADKTLTVGDKFDPLDGVTASDKEDGDLTDKIEILECDVDTSKAGTYKVTYRVTDSDGNSFIKTINIKVNPKSADQNPGDQGSGDQGSGDKDSGNNQNSGLQSSDQGNDVKKTSEIPKTEDKNSPAFWLIMLIIAGASSIGIGIYSKKRI